MMMVYSDDVTGCLTENVDSVWQGVNNKRAKRVDLLKSLNGAIGQKSSLIVFSWFYFFIDGIT